MPTMLRASVAIIGVFALAVGAMAAVSLYRDGWNPLTFITAFGMLGGAADCLAAALRSKGHWPSLLWFFWP